MIGWLREPVSSSGLAVTAPQLDREPYERRGHRDPDPELGRREECTGVYRVRDVAGREMLAMDVLGTFSNDVEIDRVLVPTHKPVTQDLPHVSRMEQAVLEQHQR